MKCHYEVLQVEHDADEDDIKKAYRRLALKWHPDKNLNNSEEAKVQFQLLQQAYEILSDPQERSWYDRHRDSILKGGLGSDYKDDSLNVYQYFTTTCFKGYGDDEKGFYAVFSEVFNKIGSEDSEFDMNIDSDFEIPVFGNSQSSYEEVIHPFYSYWQSYSTKKPYTWLDKYEFKNVPRKVLKLMEKENKKIREKARKDRNEEVRALVAFVRKRDKRLLERTLYLEKKAVEDEKKMKEFRKKQITKRKEEIDSYVECDWVKFSNLEGELREIEATVAAEFKDLSSQENSNDSEDDYNCFKHCVACNKLFKTDKAFLNHEKSKKHKDNLEFLEKVMKLDDENNVHISDTSKQENINMDFTLINRKHTELVLDEEPVQKSKSKKKTKKSKTKLLDNSESDASSFSKDDAKLIYVVDSSDENDCWKTGKEKMNAVKKKKLKSLRPRENSNQVRTESELSSVNNEQRHECAICNNLFFSKNELFKHLRLSGHSIPLTDKKNSDIHASQHKKSK